MTWTWLDEVVPDAVVVADDRQRITAFNAAAERLWGHPAAEVIGQPLAVLLPDRFGPVHATHVQAFDDRNHGARRMDRRASVFARHRDGAEIPCEVSIARRATDGRREFVAIVRDLREQKRVHQTEATLRSLFAASREAILLLDADLVIRSFNEAAAALARLGAEPMVAGEPLSQRARTQLRELLEKAGRGAYAQLERTIPSEPPRVLELSASPVHVQGALAGLVLVARDVTERRGAEAQQRQAQKMETVGRLAGGIAHDFNNLLTVIVAAASTLRRDLPHDHPFLSEVADIEGASARAAALTRQLLSFARLQPADPRVVDVSVALASLERVLRRVIGDHLVMQLRLEPGCFVRIDPTQLDQVLMNLAVNARDAMPGGGLLTISVERVSAAREVRLRVTDTGPGIDAATRARLFEPFFTTKPPGKGTGLGLATCFGIVQQAGGRIDVTSEPGAGARFEVDFPLADAPPEPEVRSTPTPPPRREVVLVAEDEPGVRSVVVRALESAGYQVLAAASGVEAMKVLESWQRPVSLLITDVAMPVMGGSALAAVVRARWPTVPVLYMSGNPDAGLGLQAGLVELIPKPFTGSELVARVCRLLDLQR